MNVVLLAVCAVLAVALLAVSWLSVVVLSEYADESDAFENG
jgi:hypothetical protein